MIRPLAALLALVGCKAPPPPEHVVTVAMTSPGASPAVIEETLIVPVEAALAALPGTRALYARADEGHALIAITGEAPELATVVHERLTQLRPQLPADARPEVRRGVPAPTPAAAFAITGSAPPATLSELAEQLRRRLERLAGVGAVEVRGAWTRRIELRVGPGARIWFAPLALAEAIAHTTQVLPHGRLRDATPLAGLTLRLPDTATLPLRDLVEISEATVHASDEPLHLRVVLQEGADRDATLALVDAELAGLRTALPAGIAIMPHPISPVTPRPAVCGPDRSVLAQLAGPRRPRSTSTLAIDRARAAELGADIANVARTLALALGEPMGYVDDRPIVLVVEPAELATLLVPTRTGHIPLSELTKEGTADDTEPRERVDRTPARELADPRTPLAELPAGYRRCTL